MHASRWKGGQREREKISSRHGARSHNPEIRTWTESDAQPTEPPWQLPHQVLIFINVNYNWSVFLIFFGNLRPSFLCSGLRLDKQESKKSFYANIFYFFSEVISLGSLMNMWLGHFIKTLLFFPPPFPVLLFSTSYSLVPVPEWRSFLRVALCLPLDLRPEFL